MQEQVSVQSLLERNALYSGELKKQEEGALFSKYTKKYGVIHNGFFYLFDDFVRPGPSDCYSLVEASFTECGKEKNKFTFCLETLDSSSKRSFFMVSTERELLEWVTMLSSEKRKYSNFERTAPDGGSFSSNEFCEEAHSNDHNIRAKNITEATKPNQTSSSLDSVEKKTSRRHSSPAASPSRPRKSTLGKFSNFLKRSKTPELRRKETVPRLEFSISLDEKSTTESHSVAYPPSPLAFYPKPVPDATTTCRPEPWKHGSAPLLDVSLNSHPLLERKPSYQIAQPTQNPSPLPLRHQISTPTFQYTPPLLLPPSPRRRSTPAILISGTRPIPVDIPTEPCSKPIPAPRTPRTLRKDPSNVSSLSSQSLDELDDSFVRPTPAPRSLMVPPTDSRYAPSPRTLRKNVANTISRSVDEHENHFPSSTIHRHSAPSVSPVLSRSFCSLDVSDRNFEYCSNLGFLAPDDVFDSSVSPNSQRKFSFSGSQKLRPPQQRSGSSSRVDENFNIQTEDFYVPMHSVDNNSRLVEKSEHIYMSTSQLKLNIDDEEEIYVVPETKGSLYENEFVPPSVYHWNMDRQGANKLLAQLDLEGLYIIRTAKDERKVLSVFVFGEARHYKIYQENSQMFLQRDHPTFHGICELIRYYRHYDLPTCSARLGQPYR